MTQFRIKLLWRERFNMENADKTIANLKAENERLRRRVAELETETEARHRSEILFRRVVEEARDGILVVDETGKIIVFNAAQAQITGRSAESVIGMDAVDLQFSALPPERKTPETYRRFKAAMSQILTTGQHPRLTGIHQYQYIGENGESRAAQKSAFPIKTD
ncbi:MAG TPA: PAS domain S-box protein, partial [Anaerolineae bacterium]|nr:PAS domain S-box protein [Anaerolineae bacterium]